MSAFSNAENSRRITAYSEGTDYSDGEDMMMNNTSKQFNMNNNNQAQVNQLKTELKNYKIGSLVFIFGFLICFITTIVYSSKYNGALAEIEELKKKASEVGKTSSGKALDDDADTLIDDVVSTTTDKDGKKLPQKRCSDQLTALVNDHKVLKKEKEDLQTQVDIVTKKDPTKEVNTDDVDEKDLEFKSLFSDPRKWNWKPTTWNRYATMDASAQRAYYLARWGSGLGALYDLTKAGQHRLFPNVSQEAKRKLSEAKHWKGKAEAAEKFSKKMYNKVTEKIKEAIAIREKEGELVKELKQFANLDVDVEAAAKAIEADLLKEESDKDKKPTPEAKTNEKPKSTGLLGRLTSLSPKKSTKDPKAEPLVAKDPKTVKKD